ncbi:MAG: UDP-N-acetylmuramate dehydrogenase [Oligoflexia bacterium]|nr:UDP-N-acetylmuramate dehydrogenase [Oligoflexia bacterium]
MPKDFFKIDNCRSISSLKPGAKIHVIGVAGVAMAQLAIQLAKQGFNVSGSDKDFWEPMGSLLKKSNVQTKHLYKREHVPLDADLVVIGNAVSYGNDEVCVVEEKNLPYTCFPKALFETVISGRHSIVVSGTHGKTTTTALTAFVLSQISQDPSYFIGGASQDLPESLHAGRGKFSVVEGDEYDSAFFAKVPKFTFYKPNTCIVNAIEFDHADIYPDVEAIKREFDGMVRKMTGADLAICAVDFPHVAQLVTNWKETSAAKILTFGESSSADVRLVGRKPLGFSQHVSCASKAWGNFELLVPMSGSYNAKNAIAVYIACRSLGFEHQQIAQAISKFQRVKRRQEVRFDGKGVTLIEDFAHHPTAVLETLQGIREAFPQRRLWAVFEPRSNTSRRKVFQDDYIKAFTIADLALLAKVEQKSIDSGHELLDVSTLADKISDSGTPTRCPGLAPEIQAILEKEVASGDVVVIMSNGAFGGLISAFEASLRARV